jgi:uncharacterized membrane protein YeaQ/YmgE (transglycosylase-associated protein family)
MNEVLSPMESAMQFTGPLQMWINDILVWIGFGTLIGLLAKALMPGRDPGGAVATLAMGVGGTVIGCGTWSLIVEGQRVTPISPIGLVVATAGAFSLLFFYRLLGGYWFLEGERPTLRNVRRRDPYRRKLARSSQYEYDE